MPRWDEAAGPPDLAAFAEGACPYHLVPLEPGRIRLGGACGLPVSWQAAGWCPACECWWHQGPAGPVATWTTGQGGKAEAAGWV
jgi:hypothetical protein